MPPAVLLPPPALLLVRLCPVSPPLATLTKLLLVPNEDTRDPSPLLLVPIEEAPVSELFLLPNRELPIALELLERDPAIPIELPALELLTEPNPLLVDADLVEPLNDGIGDLERDLLEAIVPLSLAVEGLSR